jgi:hypothetical protein
MKIHCGDKVFAITGITSHGNGEYYLSGEIIVIQALEDCLFSTMSYNGLFDSHEKWTGHIDLSFRDDMASLNLIIADQVDGFINISLS